MHRGLAAATRAPAQLSPVLLTVQNIEKLVGHDSLDIEFAVTGDRSVHILQVRPIAVTHAPEPIDDEQVAAARSRQARRFLEERVPPPPTLVGHRPSTASCPTGTRPRSSARSPSAWRSSLYRHLITDEVWARQRAEYGYRDVRPCPLLVDIVGHPYVDVRATFNSFVPAALPPTTRRTPRRPLPRPARGRPELHDKVEFDVLFTCLTPDFDARVGSPARRRASPTRRSTVLRDALRDITVGGVRTVAMATSRSFRRSTREVDRHRRRRRCRRSTRRSTISKRPGARRRPAFAHLARAAFVATSLLRSTRRPWARSTRRSDARSCARSRRCSAGCGPTARARPPAASSAWDAFVGRVRPPAAGDLRHHVAVLPRRGRGSTCAPSSTRPTETSTPTARRGSGWSDGDQRARSTSALEGAGLPGDVDAFEAFVRRRDRRARGRRSSSSRGRLSVALEHLAEFGASPRVRPRRSRARRGSHDLLACDERAGRHAGLPRAACARGPGGVPRRRRACVSRARSRADADLVCFEQQRRRAQLRHPAARSRARSSPAPCRSRTSTSTGTIVLIPSADPGYDWLLARDIARSGDDVRRRELAHGRARGRAAASRPRSASASCSTRRSSRRASSGSTAPVARSPRSAEMRRPRIGLTQRVEDLPGRGRAARRARSALGAASRGGGLPAGADPEPARRARGAASTSSISRCSILTGGNDLDELDGARNTAPERDDDRTPAARRPRPARGCRCSACAAGCRRWFTTAAGTLRPIDGHVAGSASDRADRPEPAGRVRDGRIVNSFHDWARRAGRHRTRLRPVRASRPTARSRPRATATLPQVGVMWHPERAPEDADDLDLIRALVGTGLTMRADHPRRGRRHPACVRTRSIARSASCRWPAGRCSNGSSTRCARPASTTSRSSPAIAPTRSARWVARPCTTPASRRPTWSRASCARDAASTAPTSRRRVTATSCTSRGSCGR